VQVSSFFLLSVMPMRHASRRSKPLRVGRHTRIRRLRAPMDGILFHGKENVMNEYVSAFANSKISFEVSFGFKQSFVSVTHERNM
jgi:hypothetical protein